VFVAVPVFVRVQCIHKVYGFPCVSVYECVSKSAWACVFLHGFTCGYKAIVSLHVWSLYVDPRLKASVCMPVSVFVCVCAWVGELVIVCWSFQVQTQGALRVSRYKTPSTGASAVWLWGDHGFPLVPPSTQTKKDIVWWEPEPPPFGWCVAQRRANAFCHMHWSRCGHDVFMKALLWAPWVRGTSAQRICFSDVLGVIKMTREIHIDWSQSKHETLFFPGRIVMTIPTMHWDPFPHCGGMISRLGSWVILPIKGG
jgi:hypothetical protein